MSFARTEADQGDWRERMVLSITAQSFDGCYLPEIEGREADAGSRAGGPLQQAPRAKDVHFSA